MKCLKTKIVSLLELAKIVDSLKEQNKKIVFTNGCFDILHLGHIRYLQQAKKLGDILIVGVNSDASVRKLKGNLRPIVPENERSEIIAALECIDYVIVFPELTPENLIHTIKPDIHVKGGDWKIEQIPEASLVQSYGGRVVIVDQVKDYSTTNLIKKIKYRSTDR